jgi:hypothetical protein
MKRRIEDAMVLAEQLGAGILRNLAELVVDVLDAPSDVGRGHNRRLVERVTDVFELAHGLRELAVSLRRRVSPVRTRRRRPGVRG